MPFQLTAPVYETFELTKIDKAYDNDGDPTTVTIVQASQHQHAERQSIFAKIERKINTEFPDEVTLSSTATVEELSRLEVYLTLVDSNIEDIDGKPMFRSKKDKDGIPYLAMQKKAFINAWGSLPPDICDAIHKKVLEINLQWSEEGEGE